MGQRNGSPVHVEHGTIDVAARRRLHRHDGALDFAGSLEVEYRHAHELRKRIRQTPRDQIVDQAKALASHHHDGLIDHPPRLIWQRHVGIDLVGVEAAVEFLLGLNAESRHRQPADYVAACIDLNAVGGVGHFWGSFSR